MHETLTMEGRAIASTKDTSDRRLGHLFDRFHRDLYRLALRMTSDPEEARDLVQETFLRAARNVARLPADDDGARRWLIRVTVNLCRDRYRRLGVRHDFRERHAREAPGASEVPDRDPESREVARAAVREALLSLPPRRRAVIVLRELEGRSTAEVARILGISRVTVRWHLTRGRHDLADLLIPASPPEASP